MRRVFVIGDSISVQYGPYLKQYLAGRMDYARRGDEAAALRDLDIPQGSNGGDSNRVLEYLHATEKAGGIDADVLLLNCGLHDIKVDPQTGLKAVTPEAYERNLRAIIALVRTMKPQLIWVRTTGLDDETHNSRQKAFHRYAADCDAYNAIADRVMAGAGIPVVDLYGFTKNLGPDVYCDHVHFHEDVRKLQAAYLAGFLALRA